MKIVESQMIAAPLERVFEVFSDVTKLKARVKGVTKVEIIGATRKGKGTRWRETRIFFGKEATEEMRITKYDPPHEFVVETQSAGTHYRTVYRFRSKGDGTKVTMDFEGRPVSFSARAMTPVGYLFRGLTRKALVEDMLDLKQAAENVS